MFNLIEWLRIDVYIMCLKLIKSGEVVASSSIKNYFMHAAKDAHLVGSQNFESAKKISALKSDLEKLVLKDIKGRSVEGVDSEDLL